MQLFEIDPKLPVGAVEMLINFLDVIRPEIRQFADKDKLSLESRGAVINCWYALEHLVLQAAELAGLDRGIEVNHYGKEVASLHELEGERLALFWSFMFRGTEFMLKEIKLPKYAAQEHYLPVKKQLLKWHEFAKERYLPFRELVKSTKNITQRPSYSEPSGYFAENLSAAS